MSLRARLIPPTFVFLWSTGFIGARYAMPWAEPFSFLALRFAIAFVLIGLIAAVMGSRRLGMKQTLHAIMAGALMHGVYLGGVFWAIDHGLPAGLSALIVGLQPLLTAVMAGAFLGETIRPRHWAGLAAGFAGVAIVLWPKLGAVAGIGPSVLAAALVSVIGMSAGTIWQKRFCGDTDLVTGTMWQYLGGAALTGAAAIALETGTATWNGELLFAMAWLVLVLSIGAIFLLMEMIRTGEMAKVASLFYLVPAVTAIIAFFLFGETLSPLQVFGMALASLGVGLATARPKQLPATPLA